MLEEGHVQGRSYSVRLVGIEDNFPTVIAFLERRQDIRRIVAPTAIVGDMASLVSELTGRERLEWLVRFASLSP